MFKVSMKLYLKICILISSMIISSTHAMDYFEKDKKQQSHRPLVAADVSAYKDDTDFEYGLSLKPQSRSSSSDTTELNLPDPEDWNAYQKLDLGTYLAVAIPKKTATMQIGFVIEIDAAKCDKKSKADIEKLAKVLKPKKIHYSPTLEVYKVHYSSTSKKIPTLRQVQWLYRKIPGVRAVNDLKGYDDGKLVRRCYSERTMTNQSVQHAPLKRSESVLPMVITKNNP